MTLTPLPDAGGGDAYDLVLTVRKGSLTGDLADLQTETLEVWAEDAAGSKVATATVTPLTDQPGVASVAFAGGDLPNGALWLRAVLTVDGERKTVWRRPLRVWGAT